MKAMRFLSPASAAFLLLAAAGCLNPSERIPPPRSTATLVLTPAARTVLKTIELHTALRIVLPPPSQGPQYAWEVTSNNTKVLRQRSAIRPVAAPDGTVRSYEVVFQAVKAFPPRSIVTLAAVRPGLAESEPEDYYQVTVGIREE